LRLTTLLTLGGRRGAVPFDSESVPAPCIDASAGVSLLFCVEHPARALAHRKCGVDGHGQRLVIDVDKRCGVGRCGLAFGDHSHDRLAYIKDATHGKRFLGAWRAVARKVGTGNYVDDAWRGARSGGVDAADVRAGLVAEHELHVQQAWQVDVGREPRCAGNLFGPLEPPMPNPNNTHSPLIVRT